MRLCRELCVCMFLPWATCCRLWPNCHSQQVCGFVESSVCVCSSHGPPAAVYGRLNLLCICCDLCLLISPERIDDISEPDTVTESPICIFRGQLGFVNKDFCEFFAAPEVQVVILSWSWPMPQRPTAILHNHYIHVSNTFNVCRAIEVIALLVLKAMWD